MNRRRTLFACACLGMLAFGIVLTVLGAVLPTLVTRFGIDKAQAGSLFLLMTFGILTGSIVFGPMLDRYGYKGMLLIALAFVALGLEGLAFAPSVAMLRFAIVIIGFGGGVVNGATNALVADISSEGKGSNLNLLGVFFGIGAMGMPFALATLSGRFSDAALIAGVGGFLILPFTAVAATPFPDPKQPQGFPIAAAGSLLREPLLLLVGFILFLESGMEISVGGWTSTFVNEELAVGPQRALVILSLYWMGMMLARLLIGTVFRAVSPFRTMAVCIAAGYIASLVLIRTNSVPVAMLCVFLLGVGFAATFPTVLGFVGERYAALSGTAFSLVIVMALIGGMFLPWLMGVLGAELGMRSSFVIVPVSLTLLIASLFVLSRKLR